jgi:hypothetical protein
LSDSYPTVVKQLSDNCQTQKKTGIPIKKTAVKLNLSGNIPENPLHDRNSMIRAKSGVLILPLQAAPLFPPVNFYSLRRANIHRIYVSLQG